MAIKNKNKRRTTLVQRTSSPVRVTPAFITPMAAQVVKRLPGRALMILLGCLIVVLSIVQIARWLKMF